MKSKISAMLLGAALCALTPVTLKAQITQRLVMDVPFDFQVQNQTLPAGEYQIAPGAGGVTITLRNVGNPALSHTLLTFRAQDKADQPSRAIFHRYGNRYFLAKVFSSVETNGWELLPSKAEREARVGTQLAKETVRLGDYSAKKR